MSVTGGLLQPGFGKIGCCDQLIVFTSLVFGPKTPNGFRLQVYVAIFIYLLFVINGCIRTSHFSSIAVLVEFYYIFVFKMVMHVKYCALSSTDL